MSVQLSLSLKDEPNSLDALDAESLQEVSQLLLPSVTTLTDYKELSDSVRTKLGDQYGNNVSGGEEFKKFRVIYCSKTKKYKKVRFCTQTWVVGAPLVPAVSVSIELEETFPFESGGGPQGNESTGAPGDPSAPV